MNVENLCKLNPRGRGERVENSIDTSFNENEISKWKLERMIEITLNHTQRIRVGNGALFLQQQQEKFTQTLEMS